MQENVLGSVLKSILFLYRNRNCSWKNHRDTSSHIVAIEHLSLIKFFLFGADKLEKETLQSFKDLVINPHSMPLSKA